MELISLQKTMEKRTLAGIFLNDSLKFHSLNEDRTETENEFELINGSFCAVLIRCWL